MSVAIRFQNDCTRRSSPLAAAGWRAFWAVALVAHFLALRSLTQSVLGGDAAAFSSAAARGVGLLFGVGFCGLKLLDVSFLRLKPGWRSTVSASVVIALLHVGALDRACGDDGALSPVHVGVVLFVGTFVDLSALGASVRRLWTRLSRPKHVGVHVHLNPYVRPFEAAFEPARILAACGTAPPRAPPAFV